MLGSEKQIKWATEIRANIITTAQKAFDELAPIAATNEPLRKAIDYIQLRIDLLNAEDVHAGDIIDLFKQIHFSGDYHEDILRVISVYKREVPRTKGQRTLLGRKEPLNKK